MFVEGIHFQTSMIQNTLKCLPETGRVFISFLCSFFVIHHRGGHGTGEVAKGPLCISLSRPNCLTSTLRKACSQMEPVAPQTGTGAEWVSPFRFSTESSSSFLEGWIVSLSPTLRMGPCAEDTWAEGVWFLHPPACLMGQCLTCLWLQPYHWKG